MKAIGVFFFLSLFMVGCAEKTRTGPFVEKVTGAWPPKSSKSEIRRSGISLQSTSADLSVQFIDPGSAENLAFGQISRLVSEEAMVLTVDENGEYKIYYRPNEELGYLDPETGDLLFCDYFPGTSTVLVLSCVANGNLANLDGVTYSNGQPITASGGSTAYHKDGSLMRSGSTWTYDAGASLKSGTSYWWSNGQVLKSGTTFIHPNGLNFKSGSSLFYASGNTFKNSSGGVFYPGAQTLRTTSFNYLYQTGGNLENSDTIYYSNGTVMVDSGGNVYNDTGTPSFTPFTRVQSVGTAEIFTRVANQKAENTLALDGTTGDSIGAYVSYFSVPYEAHPEDPTNLRVSYVDSQTLLFQWDAPPTLLSSFEVPPTGGFRVAAASGVSAPGDCSSGTDTEDNFMVFSGLTAGSKLSVRVCSTDGFADSPGVVATGTVGETIQTPQTASLIANALSDTFAQVYSDASLGVIYTVDKNNFSFVWVYVNDALGYINIDNGDRMQCTAYRVPWTNLFAPDIVDCEPIGNISQIPSGAQYPSGNLVRSGSTYYHDHASNPVLRSPSNVWFYINGDTMKNATTTFWPGSITMRSGTTSRYPNNAILKSGSTISYASGTTFTNGTTANYASGSSLKTAGGFLFYQAGATLYSPSTVRYPSGNTMIDSSGTPFFSSGGLAPYPFTHTEPGATSNAYLGINVDHIARYAVSVQTTDAVHVLGGNVDYSTPPPPAPTNLQVQEQGYDYVIFNFASGGGSTQDFIVAQNFTSTPPLTCDGGQALANTTFTINTGGPNQSVAVRVCARNSEGELSPGVTAVGMSMEPLAPNPTNLLIQDRRQDWVQFGYTSGGGNTYGFVYAYNVGSNIAPDNCDGGIFTFDTTFTVYASADQAVAVRVCAQNSSGSNSSGVTLLGCTSQPGDFDLDFDVDGQDFLLWQQGSTVGGTLADWEANYGVAPSCSHAAVETRRTNKVKFTFQPNDTGITDYIYTYAVGTTTPPESCDGGTVTSSTTINITAPIDTPIAIRVCSRYSGAVISAGAVTHGCTSIYGDYDLDGTVTENDYQVWRSNFGNVGDYAADGNGDGSVDAADYTVWRNNLGHIASCQ